MSHFNCNDCKVDTDDINEYYMVHDHIWKSVNKTFYGVMLCIGCLETRLGRKLNKHDFSDLPINYVFRQSNRLKDRLRST